MDLSDSEVLVKYQNRLRDIKNLKNLDEIQSKSQGILGPNKKLDSFYPKILVESSQTSVPAIQKKLFLIIRLNRLSQSILYHDKLDVLSIFVSRNIMTSYFLCHNQRSIFGGPGFCHSIFSTSENVQHQKTSKSNSLVRVVKHRFDFNF